MTRQTSVMDRLVHWFAHNTIARIIATSVIAAALCGINAYGDPLDPVLFASLGPSPFTIAGTYTINTNTKALLGPGGLAINGVLGPDSIVVFTFNSLNIGNGVTINVTGGQPLALLSKSSAQIAGAINSSANAYVGGVGGGGGSFNPFQPGFGPGGGIFGGGAGFAGAGGAVEGGGGGGQSYGNLATLLEGGSGGGAINGPGGGGGGAIEIGAVDSISVAGSIVVDGGTAGGGGGSGGAILLHARAATLSGLLSAKGGNGASVSGFPGGGGGSAGRILVLTTFGGLTMAPSLAVNLSGGTGGTGLPGGSGGGVGASSLLQAGALPGSLAPVYGCIGTHSAAIVGATVKLRQHGNDETITDSAGCFSFHNATPGLDGVITISLPKLN